MALADPTKDPRVQSLQARERVALEAFAELNRVRLQGEQFYMPPPLVPIESRLDALASLLCNAGVIDFVEFVGESLTREVEAIEHSLEEARDHKRQQSGLIVPPHRNGDS
jgi:hypothetical protein